MSATVVDASAVAAVVFDEPESEAILASLSGALLAPTLLAYEVASVCKTKLARHPAEAAALIAQYRNFFDVDISLCEPEWPPLPQLAHRHALSLYDAAYLQLALSRSARLVTLDARLAATFDKLNRRRR